MPGIDDTTPGLEDVSLARFQQNYKLRLPAGVTTIHIHNYLLLDRNTQWSVQVDFSSPERTRVLFYSRGTALLIENEHWRSPEKYLTWDSFHKAFELRYPNRVQDTTRLLFCYAVIHKLLAPSAVPVDGLKRCFIMDIRLLREATGVCQSLLPAEIPS